MTERTVHSQLPVQLFTGQELVVDEIVTTVAGTYITFFIPHDLPSAAPPAPEKAPLRQHSRPSADVAAEPTLPPDPVDEAKRLLAESGLTAPTSVVPPHSGSEPPSDVGASEGGNKLTDLLGEVRAAKKYPMLCMRAARDYAIGNVNGELTPSEEAQVRALVAEILGGS